MQILARFIPRVRAVCVYLFFCAFPQVIFKMAYCKEKRMEINSYIKWSCTEPRGACVRWCVSSKEQHASVCWESMLPTRIGVSQALSWPETDDQGSAKLWSMGGIPSSIEADSLTPVEGTCWKIVAIQWLQSLSEYSVMGGNSSIHLVFCVEGKENACNASSLHFEYLSLGTYFHEC